MLDAWILLCDSLRLQMPSARALSLIVPNTVLRDVERNVGRKAAGRLRRALRPPYSLADDLPVGVVFPNDFCLDTFVSDGDHHTEVRLVCEWYTRHLQIPPSRCKISVLKVDTAEDLESFTAWLGQGQREQLNRAVVGDFCRLAADVVTELREIPASSPRTSLLLSDLPGKFQQAEYLPVSECDIAVREGRFLRGVLLSSTSGKRHRVGACAIVARNRAIHGDIVFVDPSCASGASVVGVFERSWRPFVGTLDMDSYDGTCVACIPLDRRIPLTKLRLRRQDLDRYSSKRLVVRMLDWPIYSQFPFGLLLQTLGRVGDIDTEASAVLVEHEVHLRDFSKDAMTSLPEFCKDRTVPHDNRYCIRFPQPILMGRRDLRHSHFIMSIDPVTCTDIDDALSVRYLPETKEIEIGVHIADVAAFVAEGSPLDREARERAMTIYMVDRRMHMLPEVLSSNAASIHEGVDRLAVSVLWTIDASSFAVKSIWHGRTIICSRYALSYEQAQQIYSETPCVSQFPHLPPPGSRSVEKYRWIDAEDMGVIADALRTLTDVAMSRRKLRLTNGALELNSLDELSFKQTDTKEYVMDLSSASRGLSVDHEEPCDLMHHVIEEWMIQANAYVGSVLVAEFPRSALLRRHPPPDMEDLVRLQRVAQVAFGLDASSFPVSSAVELASSLNRYCDEHGIMRFLTTRTMSEARYTCAGETSVNGLAHYGLGLSFYTHFTSPIRRYADLVAHRLLLACSSQPSAKPKDEQLYATLVELCSYINDRHRRVKDVQQYANEWFRALFLAKYVRSLKANEFEGIIYDIGEGRLSVHVPAFRIKEDVMLENVDDSTFDPLHLCITTGGVTFRVMDMVQVSIEVVESTYHLPYVKLALVRTRPLKISRNVHQAAMGVADYMSALRSPTHRILSDDVDVSEEGGSAGLRSDEKLSRKQRRKANASARQSGIAVSQGPSLYDIVEKFRLMSVHRLSAERDT
jgi:DIS3-like exonuclease 1